MFMCKGGRANEICVANRVPGWWQRQGVASYCKRQKLGGGLQFRGGVMGLGTHISPNHLLDQS